MAKNTPFLLAILDGLALNSNNSANAFKLANTPILDNLLENNPSTTLITYGERVGLPDGQMGNSEVGHLNIGAGRVVEQDLTRINRIANSKSFNTLPPLISAAEKLKDDHQALHLIGLTSPGGVHSQLSQLESILHATGKLGIPNVMIHVVTDGRDRPRDSAINDLKPLLETIDSLAKEFPKTNYKIASLIGRFYAMDRDKRWERIKLAYDLFTLDKGTSFDSMNEALSTSYSQEKYDEFIEPVTFPKSLNRSNTIEDQDAILFFNFRADRMREIVSSFITDNFDGFERSKKPRLSSVISMCEYEEDFKIESLFPPIVISNHFGEILAQQKLKQLRIAETEKYPHVTYFFNGGSEEVLENEERILVPSPREVKTYDLKPEMSAFELTEKLLERLNSGPLDVIVLNFANCDMVGHTGNLNAAIKAVETVDTCLGRILEKIKSLNGSALITADHGNADQMIDYVTNEPHTYHTMHPVPLIYVGNDSPNIKLRNGGALCDIAPTALQILGLEKPPEMTGKSLIG